MRYNKRDLVHPDPLEFLYGYCGLGDREVAGMIASSLAYGRVGQILKSVAFVLDGMGPHPRDFLLNTGIEDWQRIFGGFRHRFTDSKDLIRLLWGMKKVIERHGSLDSAMAHSVKASDSEKNGTGFAQWIGIFALTILKESGTIDNTLLPCPARKSACKRLMLYLRWMVRCDEVDPGGWKSLKPRDLVVPLDTHMHRISLGLGLTERKSADFRTALEITEKLRGFSPDDPVKYDFSLTRFGIRSDMEIEDLLSGTC